MGKQTERKATLSWDMAPFAAAEDRILDAASLAAQSFPLAHLLWCKLQQSAQQLDDGGRFEISRGRLAKLGETDLVAIDALMSAFAEVGLIVDGKLATFVERGLSRDQRYRGNKPPKEETAPLGCAAEPQPAIADAATRARRGDASARRGRDAEAPPRDAGASRFRAESSESSSIDDEERIEVPPPSSSSDVSPARETTTTDEGILEVVSKIDQAKIPPGAIRKGLPILRKCHSEGCDLHLDIAPALAEIAAHLARPLRSISADWVSREIRAHRDKRLAGSSAPRASPTGSDGRFASDLRPNSPHGGAVNWEIELVRMRAEGRA